MAAQYCIERDLYVHAFGGYFKTTFLPSMIYMPLAGASFSFIPLMEYIVPSFLRSWVAAFTSNVTPKSYGEIYSFSITSSSVV